MQQISFHAPESIDAACDLLDQYKKDARVLAGGQSLIQMLKQRIVDAEHIIDISGIDELAGITVEEDTLWIGAVETYADVQSSPVATDAVPVLSEMIDTIGDTQIRNRGTLVGGVAHADPEGDPPVLATAMGAEIRLRSSHGGRTVDGSNFYEGFFETAHEYDEIVTAIGFPVIDDRMGAAYESFTPRDGDYAVASVAFVVTVDDNVITDSSIAVGSVLDKPIRLPSVSDVIAGETPSESTATSAGKTAADLVDPFDDEEFSAEYKTALVEQLVEKAALKAFDRATEPSE